MSFLAPPLERCRLTQPFGVDWTGGSIPLGNGRYGGYKDMGLKGHPGWDFSATTGTKVIACMDGELHYHDGGAGYGREIRIRSRILGLEAVYGHLEKPLVKNGTVFGGDEIALSDNTGASSGPHLHIGLRRIEYALSGAGPFFPDKDNGYGGYIDPAPFFAPDIFALPVDKGYGIAPVSVLEFAPAFLYFLRSQKRAPTYREYRALRFGRWDLRAVLDPALRPVWEEMSKPEARKRGIVR